MEISKKEKVTNLVFKIIFFALYAFISIFIIASLINSKIVDNNHVPVPNTPYIPAYPLTLIFVAVIFGGIGYLVLEIFGLVNIILSASKKQYPKRKTIVLRSSISIILPIITYVLIIVIALACQ